MGKSEKEKEDLTKEVEMTEHQDSIAPLCEKYKTDKVISNHFVKFWQFFS